MEYNTWSDLPADLLRLVYAKVVGLPQRVRFAAVCTSWRDAATGTCHEAPPALPWHISSSNDRIVRMFCPEDCEELHARLPGAALLKRFVGAHDGGWIAALTRIRKHLTLVVVNLLSGVEVPLSMKQGKFVPSGDREGRPGDIQKIVFSKAPTSDGCILVALTYSSAIALCRVDCPEEEGWIMTQEQLRLADIAFCNGELYGLTTMKELKELVRFDITDKDGATPLSVVVTRLLSVQEREPSVYRNRYFGLYGYSAPAPKNHLFDMGGKLAMARTWWSWGCNKKAMLSFEVLELAYDGQENTPKWEEVTTLGLLDDGMEE
ncbi:hypothetical protein ACQ4PT_069118 [Festuca glaucescens]